MDHEGEVPEALATKHRDRRSVLKFLKKLMKRYGRPLAVVTDKLRSYGAAMKIIGNADRQECEGRWINNRAENSHQPLRRHERAMLRFRRMATLQKFAAVHGTVYNHFNHSATSPADRPTRPTVQPLWQNGDRSWPDLVRPGAPCASAKHVAVTLTMPPRDVVSRGQPVQGLPRNVLLRNLSFECGTVRSMRRHGFHPPEDQQGGAIQIARSVHSEGRTPDGPHPPFPGNLP